MALAPDRPIVLVADDDAAVRAVFVQALTRGGFAAIEAEDGAGALVLIAQQRVDLLLLDVEMPGPEVIARSVPWA